jgi:pimeloyl-ACP methyl ester carboxylesterase
MPLRAIVGTSIALIALAGAPAHAKYVRIAGAPGFGPAKYQNLHVEKFGRASAKHVLVLIPGTFAGSGSFFGVGTYLSKQVPNLQVWAIDRRPNQLEDTSYMVKALKGEVTGQQLFDYYLGWIGNSNVQPHYVPQKDADFPFAKQWGLKLAMEDTRRVITEARKGGRKVILGGHSLGASSVYDYATWDFNGRPGYKDLIGLVAIDGGGMGDPEPLADAQKAVADLDKPDSSPWLDLLGINLPWTSGVFQETGAIGALKDPDSASVGQASPLLPAEFKPDVPATNKSLFGYAFDYRTSPAALGLIHIHSGHVDPNAGADGLHGWIDDGITPIERFATIGAHEPGNFTEWYYPRRLTIDVGAAKSLRKDPATTFLGLRTWHSREVDTPLYVFQTDLSQGRVISGAKAFVKQSRVRHPVYIDRSKTYSHLDPLAATPAKNDFLKTVVPFLKRLR